tara:strand:- start:337 stop:1431 length:1095 start_codon:yes stop_codon:yes gene_type:complete
MLKIPQASPFIQYRNYKSEINKVIKRVLLSGNYILGQEVKNFEKEFSNYLNIKHAISCKTGTDALFIALKQLDIGRGDEVIIPSHSAIATAASVIMSGAKPIYVDIEKDFYTIDPEKILDACNKKTKAIIVVHIYGQSCDMRKLKKIANLKKIKLIEDCAQSSGSSYFNKKLGTIGDIGCFSFFPTKNLGALGDGGCLVTNNSDLAKKIRRFRQYGWDEKRNTINPGVNSRLDELQAAILRIKLKNLDKDNIERFKQAKLYNNKLTTTKIKTPKIRKNTFHSFHLYVIQTEKRDKLMKYLKSKNIITALHYKNPIHKMPGYSRKLSLNKTEKFYKSILSLPLFPGLKIKKQKLIIKEILKFTKK